MYPSRRRSTSIRETGDPEQPRVRATVLLGVRYSTRERGGGDAPFSSGWIIDRHESVKVVGVDDSFAEATTISAPLSCDGRMDCGCV